MTKITDKTTLEYFITATNPLIDEHDDMISFTTAIYQIKGSKLNKRLITPSLIDYH